MQVTSAVPSLACSCVCSSLCCPRVNSHSLLCCPYTLTPQAFSKGPRTSSQVVTAFLLLPLCVQALGLLLCNSLLSRLGLSAVLHKAPDTLDTTKAPSGGPVSDTSLSDPWLLGSPFSFSNVSFASTSDLLSRFSLSSLSHFWSAVKATLAPYTTPEALQELVHSANLANLAQYSASANLANLAQSFAATLVPLVATYIPLFLIPTLLLQPRTKLLTLLERPGAPLGKSSTANGAGAGRSSPEAAVDRGHASGTSGTKGSRSTRSSTKTSSTVNTSNTSGSTSSTADTSNTSDTNGVPGVSETPPLDWRGPGVALRLGVQALFLLVGVTWVLEDLAQAGVHSVSVPLLGTHLPTAGPFARLVLPRCVYSLTLALLLPTLLLPLFLPLPLAHPSLVQAPSKSPSPSSASSSSSSYSFDLDPAKGLALCGYALDAVSVLSAVIVLLGGRRAACIPLLGLLQGTALILLPQNSSQLQTSFSPQPSALSIFSSALILQPYALTLQPCALSPEP